MEGLFSRLNALIGYPIKLILNNSLNLNGTIQDVKQDYLHFQNNDGIPQYIQLDAVQEVVKNAMEFYISKKECISTKFAKHGTFKGVLGEFINEMVVVQRQNLDPIYGFLSEIYQELVVIIVKDKIVYIPISKIILIQDQVVETNKNNDESSKEDNSDASTKQTDDKSEEKETSSKQTNEEAASLLKTDAMKETVKHSTSLFNNREVSSSNNEQEQQMELTKDLPVEEASKEKGLNQSMMSTLESIKKTLNISKQLLNSSKTEKSKKTSQTKKTDNSSSLFKPEYPITGQLGRLFEGSTTGQLRSLFED